MFPDLRLDYQYLLQELPQALHQGSPKQLGLSWDCSFCLYVDFVASKNLNIFESGN